MFDNQSVSKQSSGKRERIGWWGRYSQSVFFKKEQRGDENFARPRRSVAKFGWLKRIQAGFSFLFFFPSASLSLTLIQISRPSLYWILSLFSSLLFSPFVWFGFLNNKKNKQHTNKTSSSQKDTHVMMMMKIILQKAKSETRKSNNIFFHFNIVSLPRPRRSCGTETRAIARSLSPVVRFARLNRSSL